MVKFFSVFLLFDLTTFLSTNDVKIFLIAGKQRMFLMIHLSSNSSEKYSVERQSALTSGCIRISTKMHLEVSVQCRLRCSVF